MRTIAVTQAKYLSQYKIHITFSDNTEQVIDFSGFLKTSRNPMTKKFLDEKLFQDFNIVHGDIVWNDYELCFPVADLYGGSIG